ncbi:N/A [soil metagenome]
MRLQLKMIAAVSGLALTSGMAQAADTPTAPVVDQSANAVEAVIVTGEKSSRGLQETTTSVAVTTARMIEREHLQTFYDVVNRTANMSDTYGKSGFTIRGVSNTNVSGGGSSGLATIYLDGTALPDAAAYSGPLEMWDIGQVEVFRGPQSTLQGRNALAGAVVIHSTDPTFTWGFKTRTEAASGDERSIAFAGGGPIIADQLAFRVAVEDKSTDGFIYNPTRHVDADAADTVNIRGKLLLTPTALPGLRAMATYSHFKRDAGYLYTYARTDTPDYYDHRVDTSGDPQTSNSKGDIFTLDASYKITDRLTATGIVSWNKLHEIGQYDADYSPARTSYGQRDDTAKTASQELRLNYAGDRFKGLLGFYHAKRDSELNTVSLTNVAFPTATLTAVMTQTLIGMGYSQPVAAATAADFSSRYTATFPVIPVNYTSFNPEQIETTALFFDGSFDLTPKLSVLAGLRYDHEENTSSSAATAVLASALPSPSAFPAPYQPFVPTVNAFVAGMVAQAGASAPESSRKFKAWLPKIGVKYAWTDDVSTSLTAQRGYRSGGQMVNIARSSVAPYDQEYTWNYEASLRTAWLDDTLTVNANAYYTDWKDQQVTVYLGLNAYDYQVVNAGKSHLYGFEVEVARQVTQNFNWYGSVGHTRTKFDEFNVNVGTTFADLTGAEFPYAPHWTLAAGADYRWDNGLVANLNANYRAKVYSQADVNQATEDLVKARALVNGRFGYEQEHWGIYLFGKNLLDKTYTQYSRANDNIALLGDPRVIGVSLETRW